MRISDWSSDVCSSDLGIAGKWIYVIPALGLFLLLSLVFAWLAWLRFRFAVGADEIVIESGVLARQHRTIPFDRIQDVSIDQGLVARAPGLAPAGFETGAGGGREDDRRPPALTPEARRGGKGG